MDEYLVIRRRVDLLAASLAMLALTSMLLLLS